MGRLSKSKLSLSKRNKKNRSSVGREQSDGSQFVEQVQVCPNRGLFRPSSPYEADVDTDYIPANEQPQKNRGFSLYKSYNEHIPIDNNTISYMLVDKTQLTNFVTLFPCPECLTKCSMKLNNCTSLGYANSLLFVCSQCDFSLSLETSSRLKQNDSSSRPPFDVNRRMVYTFSAMGKGNRPLNTFSMHMNMSKINSRAYNSHRKALCTSMATNVHKVLREARVEVKKAYTQLGVDLDDNKPLDISVSYDGSWHKRGFTSKYGIGCCIEVTTGLVIDYEVISKYCRSCDTMEKKLKDNPEELGAWRDSHKAECQCNFDGSSPMMEVEAAERIWSRSESLGFRYTTLVSDGDSKTFSHLNSLKLYEDKEIEKVECINHVAKRLGTALRKAVTNSTKSGNPLGGKKFGSLKDSTINKLTAYYRNAIHNNIGCVENMKRAIYATLEHCQSTDTNPRHDFCPVGEHSWCFHQRAVAKKVLPEPHAEAIKTPLRQDVVAQIIKIYDRLASDTLLARCVDGQTQNANEALHGLLWSKCPKTTFVSKSTLEMRISEGICNYNTGYLKSLQEIHKTMGLGSSPGSNAAKIANSFDVKRLSLSKMRKEKKYQDYKRKKRIAMMQAEERVLEREGVTYGAGEF